MKCTFIYPPIFALLKVTSLVALFDHKLLTFFKNSPKWTLLFNQNISVACSACNIECDFLLRPIKECGLIQSAASKKLGDFFQSSKVSRFVKLSNAPGRSQCNRVRIISFLRSFVCTVSLASFFNPRCHRNANQKIQMKHFVKLLQKNQELNTRLILSSMFWTFLVRLNKECGLTQSAASIFSQVLFTAAYQRVRLNIEVDLSKKFYGINLSGSTV